MSRKLLFVVNHAGFFLSHRLPLALAAKSQGWDVDVATPSSKHVASIRDAGLAWHEVRLTRSGTNPIGELRTLADLRRLYRGVRPDLVHHVTTKPVLWGTIAARLERVPTVVNALAGLGHLSLAEDAFHLAVGMAVKAGFRLSLRHPRMKVVFQNEADRQVFVRSRILTTEQTLIVPGSGVDTDVFRPDGSHPHRPPVVMLPSRMLHTKGVGEFVEAARILERDGVPARFVLVGEPDPDNPASIPASTLEAWEAEGIIELLGRRDDMPAVYAGADVVCLPSYREGIPKVLIEASSCALPAIATDVPGCRDVVVDGETGFLVPVRDGGVEIARRVRQLLDDDMLRRDMGARGRKRIIERYSLPRIVDMTLRLYDGMV